MKKNGKHLYSAIGVVGVLAFALSGPVFADGAREVSVSGGTSAETRALTSAPFVDHANLSSRVLSDGLLTTYLPASVGSSQRAFDATIVATFGRDADSASAPLSSSIKFDGGFDAASSTPDFKPFRHGTMQPPSRMPWCDSPTPEPASMLLFGTGLLAIGAFVRRSRRTRLERA
jgi:hypothetical protein